MGQNVHYKGFNRPYTNGGSVVVTIPKQGLDALGVGEDEITGRECPITVTDDGKVTIDVS